MSKREIEEQAGHVKGAPLFLTLGNPALNVRRFNVLLPQGIGRILRRWRPEGASGLPYAPAEHVWAGPGGAGRNRYSMLSSSPVPGGDWRFSLWGSVSFPLLFFFLRSIYFEFWLCWVFTAALRLSLLAASRGHSLLGCVGRSLVWLLACGAQA